MFLTTTTTLVFLAKKIGLRRILANPLKNEADFAKNDKYWKWSIYNTIMIGTVGLFATSFFRSEANKMTLFKQY